MLPAHRAIGWIERNDGVIRERVQVHLNGRGCRGNGRTRSGGRCARRVSGLLAPRQRQQTQQRDEVDRDPAHISILLPEVEPAAGYLTSIREGSGAESGSSAPTT